MMGSTRRPRQLVYLAAVGLLLFALVSPGCKAAAPASRPAGPAAPAQPPSTSQTQPSQPTATDRKAAKALVTALAERLPEGWFIPYALADAPMAPEGLTRIFHQNHGVAYSAMALLFVG